mmetsp:Transcript_20719/g.70181  ORF Transcript_20719/g.70181 Transcript_20719/m.70181 type:complete len:343 (-) Transcript_20719:1936-2964(-)
MVNGFHDVTRTHCRKSNLRLAIKSCFSRYFCTIHCDPPGFHAALGTCAANGACLDASLASSRSGQRKSSIAGGGARWSGETMSQYSRSGPSRRKVRMPRPRDLAAGLTIQRFMAAAPPSRPSCGVADSCAINSTAAETCAAERAAAGNADRRTMQSRSFWAERSMPLARRASWRFNSAAATVCALSLPACSALSSFSCAAKKMGSTTESRAAETGRWTGRASADRSAAASANCCARTASSEGAFLAFEAFLAFLAVFLPRCGAGPAWPDAGVWPDAWSMACAAMPTSSQCACATSESESRAVKPRRFSQPAKAARKTSQFSSAPVSASPTRHRSRRSASRPR